MKNVILPDDNQRRLIFYLAMEEYLASSFDEEMFFVWQSEPTVIIGRNQNLESEVNLEYCKSHGVEVYRRKSGGGCVYSDKGNIMTSYISKRGRVADVFDRYLFKLTECLKTLGLDAVRSERNDVLIASRKISGNAFHQLPDRSIVHGTLLYDTDLTALEESINPPEEKLQRHRVQSVRQRVTNLCEYKDSSESLKSIDHLKEHLINFFTTGEIKLDDADITEIETLEKEYLTFL